MSKLKFSKEVRVGIFAILSIAILYIGFNFLKGIEFLNTTNKYYVVYDKIGALNVSNPVTINGFAVGRVSNMRINQQDSNRIVVELDLSESVVVGEGATAEILSDLLGNVSIGLNTGDITAPLSDGDTLDAKTSPSLTELVQGTALPMADSLMIAIGKANAMMDSISLLVSDGRGLIEDNRESLVVTVDRFKAMTGKINARLDELKGLDALISEYTALADSLQAIDVKTSLEKTNELLTNLNTLVEQMGSDEGSLGRLMSDDELYENLNKALMDLDTLLVHMNQNPKHFFAPLGKSRKKIERDLEKQANSN